MSPQDNTWQTSMSQIQDVRAAMVRVIARHTEGLEDCRTPVPNLHLFRREVQAPPCACLVEPSIVLVVQGVKQMLIGEEAYTYDTGRFLITSLDLPASSQVVEASPDQPCLGMTLKLDLRTMAEMIAQGCPPPPNNRSTDRVIGLGTVTPALLEPCKRLLDLIEEPSAIAMLAPLIQREIHYRLLLSDQAKRLWQIASVGSQSHWVAKAVDWLKVNYAQPLRMEELAARARMSTSSLHHHFRQLTAMSPLQYQKWLRLNEARRLMLNEHLDAANAAFHVGYESPSQFGREYSRLFGTPPKRDIEGLRRKAESIGQSRGAILP